MSLFSSFFSALLAAAAAVALGPAGAAGWRLALRAVVAGGGVLASRWLQRGEAPSPVAAVQNNIRQFAVETDPPARYTIGTVRQSGLLSFRDEHKFGPTASMETILIGGRGLVRNSSSVQYLALALSSGEIAGVDRVWIDGMEMPFRRGSDPYVPFGGSQSGWHGEVLVPDTSAIQGEIDALRTRQTALLDTVQGEEVPPLDAVAHREWFSLESEIEDRQSVLDFAWNKNGTPAVVIGLDYGGRSSTALRGSCADALARRSVAAAGISFDRGATFDGISWAWIELRQGSTGPWDQSRGPHVPNIEFLVRGIEGGTGNPATLAAWWLRTRYGVDEDDILGLAEAEAVCDQMINIPSVARGDSMADQPVHADDVLTWEYGTDQSEWPDTATQDKVLAEWNTRNAGAKPRYRAAGVVTDDMNPDDVLQALAAAMAGTVTEIGGTWRIQAGAVTAPVLTITDEHLRGEAPAWDVEPDDNERVNSVSGQVAQDGDDGNYEPVSFGPITDSTAVAADGVYHSDAGSLELVPSALQGRRLAAIALRQRAAGLLRTEITVNEGPDWTHYDLMAEDRIRFNSEQEGIDRNFRVLSAQPDLGRTVRLAIVEEPANTFDPSYADVMASRPRATGGALFLPEPGEVAVTVANDRAMPILSIAYGPGYEVLLIETPVAPDPVPDDYDPALGGSAGLPLRPAPSDNTAVSPRTIEMLMEEGGRVSHTVGVDALDDGTMEEALEQGEERGEYRIYALIRADDADTAHLVYSGVLRGRSAAGVPAAVRMDDVNDGLEGGANVLRIICAQATGGATLVYRVNGGDWTVVAARPAVNILDPNFDITAPVITVNQENEDCWDFFWFVPALGTSRLNILFAARTGAGTDTDPYIYDDQKPLALGPIPPPTITYTGDRPDATAYPDGTTILKVEA